MEQTGEKGAITVLLSIILLIIIILAGTLVDASRIITAEVHAKRAANTTAVSILAGYNSELKEKYGLFGFRGNDIEILNFSANYFMKKSLRPQEDLPRRSVISYLINPDYGNATNNTVGKDEYNFFDLYDFRVSNQVHPYFDLTQNQVIKHQILEVMKYRAPKELVEVFLKKLEILKKSGKTAELISQKVEVEDLLREVGEEQKGLSDKIIQINSFDKEKYLQPTISDFSSLIDEFNEVTDSINTKKKVIKAIEADINEARDYRDKLDERISNVKDSIVGKEKELDEIKSDENQQEKISTLEKELFDLEKERGKLLIEDDQLTNEISQLEDQLESYKKQLDALEGERKNKFNILKKIIDDLNKYITKYIDYNSSAQDMIEKLIKKSIEAQESVYSFEDAMNSPDYKDKIIAEAEAQIKLDLSDYKNKIKGVTVIYEDVRFGDISFNLDDINSEIMNKAVTFVNNLNHLVENEDIYHDSTPIRLIIDKIAAPVTVNFETLSVAKTDLKKLNDELKRIGKILNNNNTSEEDKKFNPILKNDFHHSVSLVDNYSKNIQYVKFESKEVPKNIEEYKNAMENRDASELNTEEDSIDPNVKNKDFLQKENNSPSNDNDRFSDLPSKRKDTPDTFYKIFGLGEKGNDGGILDGNKQFFMWDESQKTDKSHMQDFLKVVADLGNVIKDNSTSFRDNLYTNEYILGTFRCAIDEETSPSNKVIDYFGKYNRSAYFDGSKRNSEIEYILNGKSSYTTNIRYTQAQIYMIRTAMNLLHVYSDPDKIQIATQIATVASGPLPLLTPIISTIIIFGWASLESLFDMNMLMNGEEVPFYKISEEEWKLGYGSIAPFAKKVLVNEAAEIAEDWIMNFVDKLVSVMFSKINDIVLDTLISTSEGVEESLADLEKNLEENIDSILESIPEPLIREEIRKAIDVDKLVNNIRIEIEGAFVLGENYASDNIGEGEEKATELIREYIQKAINSMKIKLEGKLEGAFKSNSILKGFAKEDGKTTLNNLSKKSYNVKFDYYDYLRILLLMKSEDAKLRRIMDLIELNQQSNDSTFELSRYYTSMRIDVVTSIKYMFINKNFLPRELRIGGNRRHSIDFSIFKGY